MRAYRGRHIAMILQDPMAALNPVFSIGNQVAEPIRIHQRLRGDAAKAQMIEALRLLRIPSPELRAGDYPHQLSGGMRQRVLGAIALSCRPDLLIADEPTTSLDVTVQAQYLQLLRDIQREQGTAILFVTHDLSIVAEMCQNVCVMYAGRIVETAPVIALFERPAHPYTRALLAAIPSPDRPLQPVKAIEGAPPSPFEEHPGCPFAPRCPEAETLCREQEPPVIACGDGHAARCWKAA
jgi:oligopeptide/dipeptide ABC transporter ATP-binding protein